MPAQQDNFTNSLVTLGRRGASDRSGKGQPVNLPLYQCSTMLFKSLAEFEEAREQRYETGTLYYGRYGSPSSFELEDMMAKLEGGYGCVSVSSGLTAMTIAIMAMVKAGDHILVADTVYGPTRMFCDNVLARFGITVSYFDPMTVTDVTAQSRQETRAVVFEAPGSGTFEVPDIAAIAKAAKDLGAVAILDATWATPVFCKPLALGVDIVVHSGSKYIMGHADGMIGFIISTQEYHASVRKMALAFGDRAGSMDIFLALRGLRTLALRMRHHDTSGRQIAQWLQQQPQVSRVLHPALADCPGHDNWRRDFSGAGALFSVVLKTADKEKVRAFVDGLEHFAIGLSWGGFESLVLPVDPSALRTATRWTEQGSLVRFNIGNEDVNDLIKDLETHLSHLD